MAKNANDKTELTGKAKEDYDKRVAAQTEKSDKPKRRALTPEERIAKLEAELKATREKAAAKSRKQLDTTLAEIKKLEAKRNEIDAKVRKLQAEAAEIDQSLRPDEATFTATPVDEV